MNHAPSRRLLLLTALASCGDGVQQSEPVTCDPLADEGCPAGEHCRIVDGGRACLAITPPGADHTCDPGSCAPMESCLIIQGVLACRPLCDLANGDDACVGGAACAFSAGELGVCIQRCGLPDACAEGTTCAPVAEIGFPICVAVGELERGDACSRARCGAGLACLGSSEAPRCEELCSLGAVNTCYEGECIGQIEGLSDLFFCATQ